jgi:phenylpropionate dioxygenase-like ring-hydroxylating dioxygenase large terminal subunit
MIETKVDRFVRNCWYVAGWEDELTADGMFARTLLNESVLFYRTAEGRLVALENRCCHRGAPLHVGRREGDCVRCLYHGLVFNPEGRCVEVPGQDLIPPKACVRSYPVVARDELIWIWMGDPALADPAKIISYWWHTDPGWRKKRSYLHYGVPYTLIVDNLLDFSHLTYVHSGSIGTPSNATTRAEVEPIEGGLKISRRYYNDQIQANRRSIATFQGPADRWQIYEWFAPSFLRLYTGSAPAGTGAHEGRLVPEAMQYRHCSIQTPETGSSTHYWFTHAANFGLETSEVIDVVFDGVQRAFDEDRDIIQAQHHALGLGQPLQPVAIGHDRALVQARRIIDRMLQEEASAAAAPAGRAAAARIVELAPAK